jgi:hypothetical protein
LASTAFSLLKAFPKKLRSHFSVIGLKYAAGTVRPRGIKHLRRFLMLLKKITLGLLAGVALGATAQAADIKHVLLISVDGLHALDVANYVEAHPGSAMAELSEHAITYSNARTPANSDSFPGLLALVTGGSPVSHGLFYDVSYDRNLFDPTDVTCTKHAPGNTVVLDESIDQYSNGVSLNVIDPARLPRGRNASGQCVPMYPHDLIRTNTIFEVVKSKGGRTAWADKHPAYDLVNGPSGKGVDDLYTPELTNAFGGFDNTVDIDCTVANDELKVKGIINEINGLTHDGSPAGGTPTVFGMNFQAVSVGQKLVKSAGGCGVSPRTGKPGGYTDGAGTPTDVLEFGLEKTDEALGDMIQALKNRHLYESTLFIVSAKHGQSPINPAKVNKPGHFADLVAQMPGAGTDPGALAIASANACGTGPCGFVQDDDIALIWLQDQSKTKAAIDFLNTNAKALFIDEVLGGDELKLKFNDPKHDSRTPDIIVQPIYGTVYTGSTAKNAEHGGMSFADTNVGLIVSNPQLPRVVVKTPVLSSQVAPTILQALNIDPEALKSVQVEHTAVLPGLWDNR